MDFNTLLGKEMHCSCGRTHKTDLRSIDIGRGALDRLPQTLRDLGFKKAYLVSDVNTWKAAGRAAADRLTDAGFPFEAFVLPDPDLVPDERAVGALLLHLPEDADLVLGVGAGTINDLCKYISFLRKRESVILATAPSMDGFVSAGAALIVDHVKVTYDAQAPAAVIGDTEILAQAPMEMITAGLGDMLGKYTCLLDWKLAHIITGEYYCDHVEGMVRTALRTMLAQSGRIRDRDPEVIGSVTEALVLTGIAMKFVGNSRPASGCEHHMSHFWEMRFLMEGKKAVLHGTKVGVATIAALRMYKMLEAVLDSGEFDIEAAAARPFDLTEWEREICAVFGEASDGIIALEHRTRKNDPEARNRRLNVIEDRRKELLWAIRNDLPPVREVEDLLLSLDAPVHPDQIGVSLRELREAVLYAKEVRDRYTLLQLLWDLGLAEDFAGRLEEDYFQWKRSQLIRRLRQVRCFVLDMDGTIYLSNRLFPFTKPFLQRLEETGRSYCFFTNNSTKHQKDYLDKLAGMGIPAAENTMFLSTQVIIEEMQRLHPRDSFFIVGTPNLVEAFRRAGLTVFDPEAAETAGLRPDVVILGFDTTLTYEKISLACKYLRHGAAYYGVNMDYNCPVDDNGVVDYIPDCGSIAKLVERSTGRFPDFYGKPSRHALDFIIRHTGFAEEEIAVVGDRIYTDIAIANGTKALSIMVLTGETQLEDLDQYDYRPDYILPSLEDLTALL